MDRLVEYDAMEQGKCKGKVGTICVCMWDERETEYGTTELQKSWRTAQCRYGWAWSGRECPWCLHIELEGQQDCKKTERKEKYMGPRETWRWEGG